MLCSTPFVPPRSCAVPERLDSPFCNSPAPLARVAAEALQAELEAGLLGEHDAFADGAGQMFGVLVVRRRDGELGVLRAFAGTLAGQWRRDGFVPPAFDPGQRAAIESSCRADWQALEARRVALAADPDYARAAVQLAEGERQLHQRSEQLRAQLALRKAARRAAREQAGPQELARLRREGEADGRLRADDKRSAREQLLLWRAAVAVYAEPLAQLERRQQQLLEEARHACLRGYRLHGADGEVSDLLALCGERECPEGMGDCAGAKLLNHAFAAGEQPLALAQFWWGAEPRDQVRHHRHFYPSCRGRCRPLFARLLQGFPIGREPDHLQPFGDASAPAVVFEDRHLILVDKPAELLSVPGLVSIDSVQSRLQARHPDLPQLQLVHRLDQSTSGLLLAAKTRVDHKALQRQFSERLIAKEYVALLDGEVAGESGEIELPLRVDLLDRPRQLVCHQHGRAALTRWRVLAREGGRTRVALSPVTGRTHQLRVHMAHPLGLAAPIVGDELYGKPGGRLCLHAQSLGFIHPGSGDWVDFQRPAPF